MPDSILEILVILREGVESAVDGFTKLLNLVRK